MKQYIFSVIALASLSVHATEMLTVSNDTHSSSNQELLDLNTVVIDGKELQNTDIPTRKTKWLNVDYLNVSQNLTVRGSSVTATSQNGSSNLSAYGQLSRSSIQHLTFATADTWIPIVFNTASLASNMTLSTTSPGTITIQNNGTYTLISNLCILLEDAPEEAIHDANYTFGIGINGTITPAITLAVNAAGYCPFNYSTIITLSANDQITFHMKASRENPDPQYDNLVTLENGYAYVAQISN